MRLLNIGAAMLVALSSVALASSCSSSAPDATTAAPVGTDAATTEEAGVESGAPDGFVDADAPDALAFRDDAGIWHLPDPEFC